MAHALADAPNANALWAGVLVEELARQGLTHAVVCPGSRSTPLALAFAASDRIQVWVHWDERAAAFAALGLGRVTGRPAAVVTTSGTAVANLLPAAVEADADGVPLLLLTADRPPELRDTGANQTIRQPGLFASVARWSADLPVPAPTLDPSPILSAASYAVARSLSPPGPVHLNLPFREPLAPVSDGLDAPAQLSLLGRWAASGAPFTESRAPGALPEMRELAERLGRAKKGLVVAGKSDQPAVGLAAASLAAQLGWPLIADIGSQVRLGPAAPTLCAFADLALASDAFRDTTAPDAVLHVGGRVVSKRLLALLEQARPEVYAVFQEGEDRYDPAHRVTHRFGGNPAEACAHLAVRLASRTEETQWLRRWKAASQAAGEAAAAALGETLSEPFVARTVAARAPEGSSLVAAASMPIRDLDLFAAPGGPRLRTVANRGASGIDGTVATAAGVARGSGGAVTLLIGDLALLHDQTSLALLREGPPVVVVVVNNDGGGIFHLLPVARGAAPVEADVFERMFGTPHGLSFRDAAQQMGLAYARPTTRAALEASLDAAWESGLSAVIEVCTDRATNAALHARLTAAAAEAIRALLA